MPCIQDEDGPFRFNGVLEILGHLTNTFGRRSWCQEPGSAGLNLVFSCINKSECLIKLREEKEIGQDSYRILLKFLAAIPVKVMSAGPQKDLMHESLALLCKDGLACIQ